MEKEVNIWVAETTNRLIEELLPRGSIDISTVLLLVNAIYFKGEWNDKFDPSKTQDGEFHLFNGSTVSVPFMTSKKMQFVCSFKDFQVLKLPFTDEGRREGNCPCISFFSRREMGCLF